VHTIVVSRGCPSAFVFGFRLAWYPFPRGVTDVLDLFRLSSENRLVLLRQSSGIPDKPLFSSGIDASSRLRIPVLKRDGVCFRPSRASRGGDSDDPRVTTRPFLRLAQVWKNHSDPDERIGRKSENS